MRTTTRFLLVLAGYLLVGCGSDEPEGDGKGGGAGTGATGMTGGSGGRGGSSSGGSSSGGSGNQAGTFGGAPPGTAPSAMPLISRDVPAFASGSDNVSVLPNLSNDDQPNSTWIPDMLPAWLAYDLSSASAEQRGEVLVVWSAPHAPAYITMQEDYTGIPIDYSIEINAAGGGGDPPADGWETVVTVADNNRNSRHHLVNLDGGSWVRMSIQRATTPDGVSFDLDVHAAPEGASDSWMFMGDSITFMTFTYAFSNLPSLANEQDSERWPAIINAAIGGTNTGTAIEVIDETMSNFPGRYVTLNYGTNNHASDFDMESLVQRVIAANKTPVVPHVPWADTPGIQADGPLMNEEIDRLYQEYPEILPGPDLWAAFEGRTDLIPTGDVHPNDAGQEHMRQVWADRMVEAAQ